jgi:hypothetical protein
MGIKSVRFPDELEAQIKAEAERTDRSFNWVVVRAVKDALSGEPAPSPFQEAQHLVESGQVRLRSRAELRPGACSECGKSNGVHRGSCSFHPRNAR